MVVVAVEKCCVQQAENKIFIGKKCIGKFGENKAIENKVKSHLIQRLSMAIQRETATCLMSAILPEKELQNIYFL